VTPGHSEHLEWACDAADRFTPLDADEEHELAEQAKSMEPVFSQTVTAI
jgi:hypothetical protein